tara:strand:+ start:3200 stop:3448 length:249 start_codon:yes stop_codon:yes gene_type:complete
MFVKHLQEFLGRFTMGSTKYQGNAISNAKIYVAIGGHLEEIKRMEVHEHMIIGQPSLRLVLRPQDEKKLIIPDKLRKTHYDV